MRVSKDRAQHWCSLLTIFVLVSATLNSTALAQEASMEDRLRGQLRAVTEQLQQAQNELAQLKSVAASAPKETEKPAAVANSKPLRDELSRAHAQLVRERELRERELRDSRESGFAAGQHQARLAAEKSAAQLMQLRGAYDELLKLARASEADRQVLAKDVALKKTAVSQCEDKNHQLYDIGLEVLQAYEKVDVNTIWSMRQPFAAQSRVKYETVAQEYGDKLYQGKFDARTVNLPQTDNSDASKSAPATTP
jgi:colicin import membrane protein